MNHLKNEIIKIVYNVEAPFVTKLLESMQIKELFYLLLKSNTITLNCCTYLLSILEHVVIGPGPWATLQVTLKQRTWVWTIG